MKRLLVITALAAAMLVALATPALATDGVPAPTYKLTITAYFDCNGDGMWGVKEPFLPGAVIYIPTLNKLVITDCCGWAKVCVPCGSTQYAFPVGVRNPCYGPYKWITEVTPSSGLYGVAKVRMTSNKCMLFGIAPCWNVPYCQPCAPSRCVDYGCDCDHTVHCEKCPPGCPCGCPRDTLN
jgi:hypothetical protein